MLFDNRRGTCHCLMLNYWIRCGGLQAFLAQFGTAAQFLWDVTAADAALKSAPADHMEEPSVNGVLLIHLTAVLVFQSTTVYRS